MKGRYLQLTEDTELSDSIKWQFCPGIAVNRTPLVFKQLLVMAIKEKLTFSLMRVFHVNCPSHQQKK